MTAGHRRRDLLASLRRAVSLESDVLAVRPELTWQQLANRLQWTVVDAREGLLGAERGRRIAEGEVWLRLRTRFPESDALLRRLTPHTDQLNSCVLAPDGTLAVSTGTDRTVRVWNATNGRVVRVLRDAGQSVACAISPDGRIAVATDGDGVLHAWRIDDGRQLAAVAAHDGPANACAVLPDGRSVVSFGADGLVRLWSLPRLRAGDVVAEGAGHLTFGALSGDGTTVAYGSRGSGMVRLRRLEGRDADRESVEVDSPVLCCSFGHDPTVLLTGLADGRLSLWDLATGRRRDVQAHDGEVYDCAVTEDGTLAASAGDDAAVKLWRLPDLAPTATLRGHQWMVTGCGFSADGRLLISAGGDGSACLWDVPAARAGTHDGHSQLVESCAFTSDGASLLTASTDGTLRRWAVSNGAEQGPAVTHPGGTVQLAGHGDRWILAAGDDGVVLMVTAGTDPVPVGTHGAQVWALSLLAGGSTAVTAGIDGACRAWDLDGGGERSAYLGDGLSLRSCAAAPSGSRVATAGDAGVVHVWDADTGLVVDLPGERAPIWSVAMDAGGRVAAGAKDGTVLVWSDPSTQGAHLLGRHGDSVERLLWLRSGDLLSGAVDGSMAVWPLDGEPRRWTAHRGPVRGIAAAPGGEVLVSVGADGVLAVWHAGDARRIASIPFPGSLRAVAAHPAEPLVGVTGDAGLVHMAEIVGLPETW